MPSQIFVDINVSPLVYYFFFGKVNNNILRLKYNDSLSFILYPLLQSAPVGFRPSKEKFNLKIELLYKRHKNILNANYLTPENQIIINDYLYGIVKQIFHNYVLAFVSAGGSQHDGIIDFCYVYNIPLEDIKYDTLKKSWNRSAEKQNFFSLNSVPQ